MHLAPHGRALEGARASSQSKTGHSNFLERSRAQPRRALRHECEQRAENSDTGESLERAVSLLNIYLKSNYTFTLFRALNLLEFFF